MSKLTTELINDIRSSADIVDVVSKYISLTQRGKNYFGVCPFHDDHSPSMSVSKEKQIYTCFSCGATGNVFKFVMDYDNVSFPEAVKIIADISGIKVDLDDYQSTHKLTNSPLYNIYDLSLKFYQNNLNTVEGKRARDYLYKRQINDDMIKYFEIGYALKQRGLLTKLLLKKDFNESELVKSGLVTKSEYGLNDIYSNRIMFPLHDLNGNVVGYSGRTYDISETSKYINTKETEIFKKGELLYNYYRAKEEARNLGQVIIMEGFMDVIRAYSIGIKNVVATMGTAVTKNQALLIKRMANEVILLFDGDKAGAKATFSCANELLAIGVNPKIVRLEENLDPDEYILKYGKDKFIDKINNPITVMDFKLDYLKKDKNLNDSNETASYVNEILSELNSIDDDILREITLTKLSKDSSLDIDFLRSKLNVQKKPKKIEKKVEPKKVKLTKYEKAEVYLVNYMLKSSEVVNICINKLSNLPTKKYRDLERLIITYYKTYGYISEVDFLSYVLDKDKEYMNTIEEIHKQNIKENFNLEEINDYINVILDYNIEEEKKRLTKLLHETNDNNKKREIGQKLVELKILRGENI